MPDLVGHREIHECPPSETRSSPITPSCIPSERYETYAADPHLDKEAVEPIVRRCETRGTALAVSGSELIVWKKT